MKLSFKAFLPPFAAMALSGAATQASAVMEINTYDFTGVCSDCSGDVTAELTVESYTPGTALNIDNFVSFLYSGSNLLPSYRLDTASSLSGSLGTAPGFYTVALTGYGPQLGLFAFSTTNEGAWSTGQFQAADVGVQGQELELTGDCG